MPMTSARPVCLQAGALVSPSEELAKTMQARTLAFLNVGTGKDLQHPSVAEQVAAAMGFNRLINWDHQQTRMVRLEETAECEPANSHGLAGQNSTLNEGLPLARISNELKNPRVKLKFKRRDQAIWVQHRKLNESSNFNLINTYNFRGRIPARSFEL